MNKHKLSTWQLALISTGGMFGAGWLFSPYYGFQMAGVGVLFSWIITAALTIIIGLAFIEIASLLPVLGGISRFVGVTHNRNLAFIFLSFTWLSYVVYLPLEAQSAIQYIGFWWSDLVHQTPHGVELSKLGFGFAIAVILGLTWFNTFFITNVAKLNSWVSVGKLMIPVCVVVVMILSFGKWQNITDNLHATPISFEHILLAITTSGLAFAFTGFQNALILANYAKNYKKAVPASIFSAVIFGGLIYFCLSLAFIACLPAGHPLGINAVAPLLGLVVLFNAHILFTILFLDAVSAPLGTANVYTAVTGRVLYSLGTDFFPKSFLTKLNKFKTPSGALWLNGFIGICFLMPFPTWKQLVDFLSSIVVFSYLAAPIALIILRRALPDSADRVFKVKYYNVVGYLGFACCSLLIYWSGQSNLFYLTIFLVLTTIAYGIFVKGSNPIKALSQSWYLVIYVLLMGVVSHLREANAIGFPIDNLFIIALGLITCKIMLSSSLKQDEIVQNMSHLKEEVTSIINE